MMMEHTAKLNSAISNGRRYERQGDFWECLLGGDS